MNFALSGQPSHNRKFTETQQWKYVQQIKPNHLTRRRSPHRFKKGVWGDTYRYFDVFISIRVQKKKNQFSGTFGYSTIKYFELRTMGKVHKKGVLSDTDFIHFKLVTLNRS
jgi:hypothetical protein